VRLVPDYPIRTERLLLRPLGPLDADDLLAYRSRPEVCLYVPFQPMSRESILARFDGEWAHTTIEAEGDRISLGIELTETSTVVGDIILMFRSAANLGGEIGWVLNPDYSGRGYATEAARALLQRAFDDLGLRRVIARIDARNDASIRLARRLGMRQEAHLVENELFKGEWTDELDFAILAREWAALS
jgi:RimJ/RimL family protein N-acetyltransferase